MQAAQHYYIPSPSHWPIVGSVALLFMGFGAALWINHIEAGPWVLVTGLVILAWMMFGWFGTVSRESETGTYNTQVDISFRWSMSWFIFSEVMFFAAFFGALFYMRELAVPGLGSGPTGEYLWPMFKSGWPVSGPGIEQTFTPMGAWGIPAINTLILLTSGATVTWAHWGLKKNNRGQLNFGLFLTIVLGISFLCLQVYEYVHAIHEYNLTLQMGAYGASFFMLTGFHGFHVTMGTLMLIVILFRCLAGHFKPEHHFAFEAVSWYWHFVDVVWLLLFILVYWL
ncbi:MAG: cytochrome c oxidase subunit 3 [Betaproteobacteria bacterium]|nr:cytochrome c oxidase subunit 3 [Betaproteobacteria bacterium]